MATKPDALTEALTGLLVLAQNVHGHEDRLRLVEQWRKNYLKVEVNPLRVEINALAKLRRATDCSRCSGSGTITDRHGDLDECPDCRGTGAKP